MFALGYFLVTLADWSFQDPPASCAGNSWPDGHHDMTRCSSSCPWGGMPAISGQSSASPWVYPSSFHHSTGRRSLPEIFGCGVKHLSNNINKCIDDTTPNLLLDTQNFTLYLSTDVIEVWCQTHHLFAYHGGPLCGWWRFSSGGSPVAIGKLLRNFPTGAFFILQALDFKDIWSKRT